MRASPSLAFTSSSSSSSSSVSLDDVRARSERLLRRGHRLVAKRRELERGLERVDASDEAQKESLRRDVARVDASVDKVIERVEALREIARALEDDGG
jgi:hypothetical protein